MTPHIIACVTRSTPPHRYRTDLFIAVSVALFISHAALQLCCCQGAVQRTTLLQGRNKTHQQHQQNQQNQQQQPRYVDAADADDVEPCCGNLDESMLDEPAKRQA
jgi:hypothetical protein